MTTFSIGEIVPEAHSQFEQSSIENTERDFPFEDELYQPSAYLSRDEFFHRIQEVNGK